MAQRDAFKKAVAPARNAAKRYSRWMVTVNDVNDDQMTFPPTDDNVKYFVYQEEIAPETGRHHYQCFLMLKRQTDFTTVKNYFSTSKIHLEKCNGPSQKCRAYCMKEDTRHDGPYEIGTWEDSKSGERTDLEEAKAAILAHTSWAAVLADDSITKAVAGHLTWARAVYDSRPIKADLPDIELRTWQTEVMELLNGPPVKRRIIWIWSTESGTGKTTFFDYVSSVHPTLPGADWSNTLYCYDGQRVIWFDRTRAESNSDKSVDQFYVDLEKWSNCTIHTSTKYSCCRKLVAAHIVVTANAAPDQFRLPDRFYVVQANYVPKLDEKTRIYETDDE